MIRFGVIGFGKMGKIRVDALNTNGGGKVVLAYDSSDVDYIDIPVAKSIDEVINNKDIDAVFLCTPNYLNKPLTIQALKANKHVFCEKPPALNYDELLEVKKIAGESSRKLMYGFNHRHHSSIKMIKQEIDSGEFGKVLWMRGRYGKSVDKNFFDNNWRAKKELSGGGILLDQGIHMLDLFLYLGEDFDKIHAFISNLYWKGEVEDNAFVILKNSKTGIVASLHSTMTQWRHLFSLEIFLEKGYFVLNGLKTTSGTYGDEVLTIAKNRTTSPAATWEDEEKITFHSSSFWRSEIDHFVAAIINDQQIKIGNLEDSLNIMKLVKKIYEVGE
jgi:predicted dehydrogenase